MGSLARLIRTISLVALVAWPLARAVAQTAPSPKPKAAAPAMKMPQTVEDHLALAKKYQDQAASYRALAEEHRTMAAEYKKSATPAPKTGPNPWVKKMEAHCMAIVKDAEKLATDADKAAEYHTFRAKELQGK